MVRLPLLFLQLLLLLLNSATADLFDSSGRLSQVEYANRAVRNGATSVSIRSDDVIIHVTFLPNQRGSKSPLCRPPEKVRRLSDSLAVSTTGIVADAQYVVELVQAESSAWKAKFGSASDPSPARLAESLASFMSEKTTTSFDRPLGVTTLFLCFNAADDCCRIYQVDPIGRCRDTKLVCLGKHSKDLLESFSLDFFFEKDEEKEKLQRVEEEAGQKEQQQDEKQAIEIEIATGATTTAAANKKKSARVAAALTAGDLLQKSLSVLSACILEKEGEEVDVATSVSVYIVGRHTPFKQLSTATVCTALRSGDFSRILDEEEEEGEEEGAGTGFFSF